MKHFMKKYVTGLVLFFTFLFCLQNGKVVHAETSYQVSITGYNNYYKILDTILERGNEARAAVGASNLVLDENLTAIAMQRAAEIAVYYSHIRPDGTEWSTAVSGYGSTAENIAAGQTSASEAIEAWIASEGHYKNLINSTYVSTGIGSFYHNGLWYWVQLFSSKASTDSSIEDLSGYKTHAVKISESRLSNYAWIMADKVNQVTDGYVMGSTETENFQVAVYNTGTSILAYLDGYTWSSSDSSVLSVDASTGVVTVKGVGGPVTITASQNGYSVLAQVYGRKNIANAEFVGLQSEYEYESPMVIPEFTVKYNGVTLTEGIDYSVTNGSNYVTIEGIGNYTGSVTKTFTVIKYDAAGEAVVTLADRPIKDGEDVDEYLKSIMTVTYKGRTLEYGTDYSLYGTTFYKSAEESYGSREYFSFKIRFSAKYGFGIQSFLTMGAYELNEIADQIYTGSAIEPTISFGSGAGYSSRGLIEGDTITVTYENNVNVGTATVTVTGNGVYYVGSVSQTFKIVKASGNSETSTGNTANITFHANGGTASKSSKTYTIGSKAGTLPGATRKGYTFKSWYTAKTGGSKVTSSTVVKGSTTYYARWSKVKVAKATIKKLAKGSRRFKVTVKKVSGAVGYQIKYALKANMKSAKKTTMTSNSTWIKNLKKNRRYYVQVRAYKLDSTGSKVYGSWSTKKSIKVK